MNIGKYVNGSQCDWCQSSPAKEVTLQKNGTKTKRYAITAMACADCARRLGVADD